MTRMLFSKNNYLNIMRAYVLFIKYSINITSCTFCPSDLVWHILQTLWYAHKHKLKVSLSLIIVSNRTYMWSQPLTYVSRLYYTLKYHSYHDPRMKELLLDGFALNKFFNRCIWWNNDLKWLCASSRVHHEQHWIKDIHFRELFDHFVCTVQIMLYNILGFVRAVNCWFQMSLWRYMIHLLSSI